MAESRPDPHRIHSGRGPLLVVAGGELVLAEPGTASPRAVDLDDLQLSDLPEVIGTPDELDAQQADLLDGAGLSSVPCALRLSGPVAVGWTRDRTWKDLFGIDLRHARFLASHPEEADRRLAQALVGLGVPPEERDAVILASRRRLWDVGLLDVVPDRTAPGRPASRLGGTSSRADGPTSRTAVPRVDGVPLVWAADHAPDALPLLALGSVFAAIDASRDRHPYDLAPLGMLDVSSIRRAGLRPGDVVLCSDYVWSVEGNLALSRELKQVEPDVVVVHGGPSVPKYREDLERFLRDHPEVDVAVIGEGERTAVALLEALGGRPLDPDRSRIEAVAGLAFTEGDGRPVITSPRDRMADLESLPSPYLTGLYDHLSPGRFWHATVETNRGCPYGCTFCDWGSATMARVRKFPLDRVLEEITWVAEHRVTTLFIADANFGIYPRDVEIAEHVVRERTRTGYPLHLSVTYAKNASPHTPQIVDLLVSAGICTDGSIAIQSFEPEILRLANRTNIKTERYDALLERYRTLGLPVTSDLLIGLPGFTAITFRNDLQACFDRDLSPRLFPTMLLPNSPMNEPGFRSAHAIEVDASGYVIATDTYGERDYEGFLRSARLFLAADHYGLLRYVLRYLQWELGTAALDVLEAISRATDADPDRWPLLAWLVDHFDELMVQPGPWGDLVDEFESFATEHFGLDIHGSWSTARAVQEAVLPDRWASYPLRLELEHDYAAYTGDRWRSVDRPLATYGPGELVIDDPGMLHTTAFHRNEVEDRRAIVDHPFWISRSWELESAIARNSKRFDAVLTESS